MGGPGSGRRKGAGNPMRMKERVRPKSKTFSTFRKGDTPSPKPYVGRRKIGSKFRK